MDHRPPVAPRFPERHAASLPDWDQLYAEQLTRVQDYFCRRAASSSEVEHLTACVFSRAWPDRGRYRHDSAAFAAYLMACAYQVAAERAVVREEMSDRVDNRPAPEFAIKLRTRLEAQELTRQLQRRQIKLHALLLGVLLAAVLVLAIPPARQVAGRLIERQAAQLADLLDSGAAQSNRQWANPIPGSWSAADPLDPWDFADESWFEKRVAGEHAAASGRVVGDTAVRTDTAVAGARARVPVTGASLLHRETSEVRVGGSRLTLLLFTPAIEASRGVRSVRISRGLNSEAAFTEFCGGRLDVVATSRPMPRVQQAGCAAAQIGFIELPVAYAAIVILARQDSVSADPFTFEQLLKILEPRSEEDELLWSDINRVWPATPVVVHVARDGGSVSEFFEEITGRPQAAASAVQGHRDIGAAIAALRQDEFAIAAVPFGYHAANEPRPPAHVHLVRVQDRFGNLVRPSRQAIEWRHYDRLSRVLFVYLNARAALDLRVRGFIEEMLKRGDELASNSLLLPLEPGEYQHALQNLQLHKLGSAFAYDQADGLPVSEILQRNASSRP
jgi:phosphate transport system substrate-binding protein